MKFNVNQGCEGGDGKGLFKSKTSPILFFLNTEIQFTII